jgi:hypothetical protein
MCTVLTLLLVLWTVYAVIFQGVYDRHKHKYASHPTEELEIW